MFFKRIEINGFKSFADPVTIEFTDGITCIVGPNGSGKSNISDAIRWVLGEQSAKSLRGDKMEEIIFAGTQSRKAKGMAEVTLVIDNRDHLLPIDFQEVGITRRAYRSGENEYYINNVPCRLRDIRELIMDTGIGVEGYSIVGQGKIADIVSNRMESRREIFEEAAGIVKYRTKKGEAEKKISAATDNLSRVNDIIREIESRIGGLKEASEKASLFLDIRDKYKTVEVNIILKSIEAADQRTASVREELSELARQIEAGELKRSELEKAVSERKKEAAELDERLEALRQSFLKITGEIHEISSKKGQNKERMASLEKDRERLTAEISASEDKIRRERNSAEAAAAAALAADEEARKQSALLDEKSGASERAAGLLEETEKELNLVKNAALRISGEISAENSARESLKAIEDALVRRAARLREDGELKNLSELDGRISQAEKTLSDAEGRKEKAVRRSEEIRNAITAAESELAIAVSDAENARITQGKLSERLALLDELERSYEGYGGGVKYLMASKAPGIIGTIGDLLEVPKGLETAIETVLGGKLQDIVCRDDDSAKRSIELLKKGRAGRLTFLPLESLRPQPPLSLDGLRGEKGLIGLASDEVGIRAGCECVTDYVLGNVVIVEGIDDAIRMSAKKVGPHKFVTLEGEVVNAAGAISGGSVRSGAANILSRKAEKADLSEKLKQEESILSAAGRIKDALNEKIESLRAEKAGADAEIKSLDIEIAMSRQDLELAGQAISGVREAEARRLAELDELEKEISSAEDRILRSTEKSRALEVEALLSESRTEELAEKAEKARAAYRLAQEEETSARLSESSASIKAKNAAELAALSENAALESEKDREYKLRQLESGEISIRQILEFEEAAGEVLRGKEKERDDTDARIREAGEEKTRSAALLEELDAQYRLLEKDLQEKQLRKYDADVRAARFDSQTENLKEKLFDEFELSYAEAAAMEDPDFVMSRAVKQSREYRDKLKALGDVNIGAIEEYRSVRERYDFMTAQRDDILKAMAELESVAREMDSIIRARFRESFNAVSANFEETFKELFGGGIASLYLEDPEKPLDSAIEIEAQPPGKKLKSISLLSGGERTMTAIALMFAVLKAKPTPFCILDEVEAALDEINIECFAKYVKKFESTQFALVTHQKLTMEYADALYGVTMPEQGITKVLSLRLGDDFEV